MQKLGVGEEFRAKISDLCDLHSDHSAFPLAAPPPRFRFRQYVRMKILGIELSKPSFGEVTAAAVMAAGLWLACVALWRVSDQPMNRIEAGAALLVIFWGCVGVRMGIRFDKGLRHVAANMLCAGVILAVYHGIMAFLA
jgi:hypothetical protein